jgi:hypothetical protein
VLSPLLIASFAPACSILLILRVLCEEILQDSSMIIAFAPYLFSFIQLYSIYYCSIFCLLVLRRVSSSTATSASPQLCYSTLYYATLAQLYASSTFLGQACFPCALPPQLHRHRQILQLN